MTIRGMRAMRRRKTIVTFEMSTDLKREEIKHTHLDKLPCVRYTRTSSNGKKK